MGVLDNLLDEAVREKIYQTQIKPSFLEGAEASNNPIAVLVGGLPAAGDTFFSAKKGAEIRAQHGEAINISTEQLREFHPVWKEKMFTDPKAAELTQADSEWWNQRLMKEGIEQKTNLLLETNMQDKQAVLETVGSLKAASFEVHMLIVTEPKEHYKQTILARYDLVKGIDDNSRFTHDLHADNSFNQIRSTALEVEKKKAVDYLEIINSSGRAIYSNKLDGRNWQHEPVAGKMLDYFHKRDLVSREKVDQALRWEVVINRLRFNDNVSHNERSDAMAWRDEAVLKAERDPNSNQLLGWSREAEAFRKLHRKQFLNEFPHLEKAIQYLDRASNEAEKLKPEDGERFYQTAKLRISERIEKGDFAPKQKEIVPKKHDDLTR